MHHENCNVGGLSQRFMPFDQCYVETKHIKTAVAWLIRSLLGGYGSFYIGFLTVCHHDSVGVQHSLRVCNIGPKTIAMGSKCFRCDVPYQ